MPAFFNVADVGRVVTGKVQNSQFVCEHMSAGTITCSALQIDGQPSQINVAGTMQLKAGTVSGSLGIFDIFACNSISIAGQASLSALSLTGTVTGACGNFSSVNLSTLTSLNVSAQNVTTGTLTSGMTQTNDLISTNLTVTGSVSCDILSSQLLNSSNGQFATVTGLIAQISGAMTAGSVSCTAGSFLSVYTNTLTSSNLTLNGSACVSGAVSAQTVSASTLNISTLSGYVGSFSTSLCTGNFSSTNATLGNVGVTNLTVSGSSNMTALDAVSLTSSSLQSTSITTTALSVSAIVNASTMTCNYSSVSALSVGSMYSSGINISASNVLNFGSDQTKAINAGQIGYQLTTRGALDIYGAGTALGSRNLQLWDNVGVVGTLTTANIMLTGKITSPSFTPLWTSVGTFLNNWSAYVGQTPPGYWKDPFGIVHLRGLLRNTAASTGICFVLPTGCLPVNYAYFACSDSNADANSITVCITSSANGTISAGSVTIATSTVTVSLDGVTFATN